MSYYLFINGYSFGIFNELDLLLIIVTNYYSLIKL